MRTIFLLSGLLFFFNFTWAQIYKITAHEVINKKINKHEDGKVDLNSKDWQRNAFIIFSDMAAEIDKLNVTFKGDKTSVIQNKNVEGDDVKVTLTEAINVGKTAFDIYHDTTKIGEVKIEVIKAGDQNDGQKPPPTPDSNTFETYMGALANANFIGNNKFLSNLTPVINLGGVVNLYTSTNERFSWSLDVNPYIGGEIDTKDSTSFIPALMLYGRGGFVFNNYLNLDYEKVHLSFMPIGFGLKFIPNLKDSGRTIIQHNLRAGIALRYADVFSVSAHLTHGWHNLTSQSKENYKKIFTNTATDITYLTVTLQMALRGTKDEVTNYIYFEWRGLLSKKPYEAFNNNTILTLGLRKTLELGGGGSSAFRQASSGGKNRNRIRRAIHQNL